jgi:surfeit locus 1 family protein
MTDTPLVERTFRCGRWHLPLWATVIAGAGIILLLVLALWQVQRLQWKNAMIAERQARMAQPEAILPAAIADPDTWNFRPVAVTGTFDHGKEAFLGARSLRGNVGYHLVTPLRRADGPAVLINRGWIPLDRRDPATRGDTLVAGEVTVSGIARATGRRTWLTPDDSPEENFWFVVDIAAMARHMGLDRVAPVFIEAAAGPEGTLPVGGQTRSELPNDHLQYAIIWFALAISLAVIYVIYVRGSSRS